VSRRRPELVIVLPYEGAPAFQLVADSFETEQAFRIWLTEAPSVLPGLILALFDAEEELAVRRTEEPA
jgi:hypothetical protein